MSIATIPTMISFAYEEKKASIPSARKSILDLVPYLPYPPFYIKLLLHSPSSHGLFEKDSPHRQRYFEFPILEEIEVISRQVPLPHGLGRHGLGRATKSVMTEHGTFFFGYNTVPL